MASKNLYLNIIFRSCLITIWAVLAGWLVFHKQFYLWSIVPFALIVFSTIKLIQYLNRTNKQIAFFFEAIRNDDLSLSFSEDTQNEIINELHQSLNQLNRYIKKVKVEQKQQEQYYQAILEYVPIGVISFNEKGTIFIANNSAKKLLNYEHLSHIRQFDRIDHQLYSVLKEIQPGDQRLVKLRVGNKDIQLSLKSTQFKTTDELFQLLTIQDIKSEIEQTELESWIKLIRVLTHEIMNTIAPITSLSETILGYYKNEEVDQCSEKTIKSTIKGLEIINDRGKGLMRFVDSYRKLTRLPKPNKKTICVSDLFGKIIPLMTNNSDVEIEIKSIVQPPDLEILADEEQISQVIINLCKNSIEALKNSKKGKIILQGMVVDSGKSQLIISDNGVGIAEENMDKIFIPFFTTKESGSGVGLSLSRQIMQLHGGSLTARSTLGEVTLMIMTF